jgi:hypothetical protein
VVTERTPQPGRLNQELETNGPVERVIAARGPIADRSIGDISVDVERGGTGWPVTGALLPMDRPPRERRALQPESARLLARQIERLMTPAQGVTRGTGGRVGEDR